MRCCGSAEVPKLTDLFISIIHFPTGFYFLMLFLLYFSSSDLILLPERIIACASFPPFTEPYKTNSTFSIEARPGHGIHTLFPIYTFIHPRVFLFTWRQKCSNPSRIFVQGPNPISPSPVRSLTRSNLLFFCSPQPRINGRNPSPRFLNKERRGERDKNYGAKSDCPPRTT